MFSEKYFFKYLRVVKKQRIFVSSQAGNITRTKPKSMKKLTVYFGAKTANASMYANYFSQSEAKTFSSAEEWFEYWNSVTVSGGGKMRVKRMQGNQFGDDAGRYTLRMAKNDFKKFAA